jgi:predicted small metal-binding protein
MDSETARFECPETDCQFSATANDPEQLARMVEKHVRDRHGRAFRSADLEAGAGSTS